MNTLSVTTSAIMHALPWALLSSLWQGLLIYGSLYILLKAFPGTNARLKYYLSFGSCAALFLWFADTWSTQYQKLKGITVYITQSGLDAGSSVTYPVKVIAGEQSQRSIIQHILPTLEKYYPFIITLYVVGLAFMLFRFLVNLWQVNALKNRGIVMPEPQWSDFLQKWQQQFEITRTVKIYLSNRINVPMMLGALKPVILLPVATINHLTTEQVEAIILHELAHIKRHDYLLNIFQTIAETILFFNPFVWFISAIIRREREHCCDDLVISCAASPLPYARALAILEDHRMNEHKLALAVTGHKNQLFHRIKRIMEMKKNNINYSQLAIMVVAIIAITFTVAMFTFTPSFAQKAKTKTDDTASSKSNYTYKVVTVDKNGKKKVITKHSDKPLKDSDIDDAVGTGKSVQTIELVGDDDDTHGSGTSFSASFSDDGNDIKKIIEDIVVASKDVSAAIAGIDMKEIDKELDVAQKEMDKVDWGKIRAEIDRALDEVDREVSDPKKRKELKIEIKRELENSRAELERAKAEMADSRRKCIKIVSVAPPAPPAPPDAPSGMVAPVPPVPPVPPVAHGGSNDMEGMLKKMEREGLIDRSRKFKIESEDNELYINGKKQSEDVFNEYRKYLKDKNVNINGSKGSLSISVSTD